MREVTRVSPVCCGTFGISVEVIAPHCSSKCLDPFRQRGRGCFCSELVQKCSLGGATGAGQVGSRSQPTGGTDHETRRGPWDRLQGKQD